MKKLFSTMLAATMVAGMAVTAFAGTKAEGITTKDNHDFGVIGAYDEDGNIITGKTKLDGGKKLYFPILVSGEELLDQKDNAKDDNGLDVKSDSQMYFATKASEVKNLKASVKDEIGGKYIDSAAIVKKDIKIDNKANATGKWEDSFADYEVEVKAVEAKLGAGFTVTGNKLVGGRVDAASNVSGLTIKHETAPAEAAEFDVTIDTTGFTPDDSKTFKLELQETGGSKVVDATVTPKTGNDANEVAKLLANQTFTGYKVRCEGAKLIFTAEKAGLDKVGKATATADSLTKTTPAYNQIKVGKEATTEEWSSTVEYKKAPEGKASEGSFEVTKGDKKVAIVVTGKNSNKYAPGTALSKIYCVEVKMADYFKPEETEVEFNIKLKDGGKTAFDTDDDSLVGGPKFNATFDLGKDTKTLDARIKGKDSKTGLEVKKFKKGDLEIKIGKDTRSVQLDEAINAAGDKEDITNIYIENDKSIDNAFTFDVKASDQDDLYLELNQDAVKDLAVSNSRADLTFFNFPGKPEFDFTGKATFAVEDDDKDNYFYEIVDGELVESKAKYNKEDGVFELRTNKLGSYVISDKELKVSDGKKEENDTESKEQEGTGGDATVDATTGSNGEKGNANTGAADLIGVASALAVVSIAAAGAVALKK